MTRGRNTYNMEGRLAAMGQKPATANPYEGDAAKWNAWNDGWNMINDRRSRRDHGLFSTKCLYCAHYASRTGAWGFCNNPDYKGLDEQPANVERNGCDWPRLSREAKCDQFELSNLRKLEFR